MPKAKAQKNRNYPLGYATKKVRPRNENPAKRKCLGLLCGKTFLSRSAGNRMCPTCTKRIAHLSLARADVAPITDLRGA